jgi:hypothetical protein
MLIQPREAASIPRNDNLLLIRVFTLNLDASPRLRSNLCRLVVVIQRWEGKQKVGGKNPTRYKLKIFLAKSNGNSLKEFLRCVGSHHRPLYPSQLIPQKRTACLPHGVSCFEGQTVPQRKTNICTVQTSGL